MSETSILWLSVIWIPLLICFLLRNDTKFKKNIAVGVTFPFEGRTHPEVVAYLKAFKFQELLVAVGLTALGLLGLFQKDSGTLHFNYWFFWLFLCMLVPYIPYVLCNHRLKQIKAKNGWTHQSNDRIVVDLSAIPTFKWISPWSFVPALVISLLPLLWSKEFAPVYLVDAGLIVLFWLGYRYLFRSKTETVDDNLQLTIALTRIRRCQWGKMWLLCAYAMAFLNLGISLTLYHYTMSLVVTFGFMVLLVGCCIGVELQTRRFQEKLTENSGKGYYVDEDDKWLGGIVYYNPNDSRLIINDRVGTNSGINLAKPMGKLLYGMIGLLLLSIPFWGLFFPGGEITASITQEEVSISSGRYEITVPVEDVESVTLLEELPEMVRTFGNGLPNCLSGNFSSREYGSLKVCLDPTAPPFLLIQTPEEQYLVGTRSQAVTIDLYKALQ